MRRKLPPLNSLMMFESVGRNMSLRLAAEEIHVTHSAVSQQIRNLENFLSTPLFSEKGKRMSLTPQGRRLLEILSGSFDEIQKQTGSMAEISAPRHLKIASSQAIASSSIPVYATEFIAKQHIADFTWVPVEDFDETVDLVITGKDLHISGEIDVEQVSISYFPVCSPKLLHSLSLPRKLSDLKGHVLIHGDNDGKEWQRYLKLLGKDQISPKGNLYLGNTFLAHQAARNGCGIALGDEIMVDIDLRDGSLICPILQFVPAPAPIRIILPFENRTNEVARSFRSWFLQKVAQLKMELQTSTR